MFLTKRLPKINKLLIMSGTEPVSCFTIITLCYLSSNSDYLSVLLWIKTSISIYVFL